MQTKTTVSKILEHKGSHVHSVGPEAAIVEAVRLMNQRKVGALLVIHNNRPVGMLTERDVLLRVVDAGRDPKSTQVRAVMTENLIVVRPTATIEDAMRIITQKRCRHLPVIQDDALVGLVSIGDIMRWLVREHENYIENLLDYISGPYPS